MTQKDSEEQRRLNRKLNPPQTVPNEATQAINPVTGRAYEDFGRDGDNVTSTLRARHYFPERKQEEPTDDCIYSKYKIYKTSNVISADEVRTRYRDSSDLEPFNCQLALARKEVRDGKMPLVDYSIFVSNICELTCRLEDAGIPLSSINTASGLDNALRNMSAHRNYRIIEKEKSLKKKYPKYIISDLLIKNDPIKDNDRKWLN